MKERAKERQRKSEKKKKKKRRKENKQMIEHERGINIVSERERKKKKEIDRYIIFQRRKSPNEQKYDER